MNVTVHASGGALELRAEKGEATHLVRLPIDRQDQGEILWFDASLWDAPSGAPIASSDLSALLDAAEASPHGSRWIAAHADGYDVLLRAPRDGQLVGTYETGVDTGYVTLLEVGRTTRAEATLRAPRGLVKAALQRDAARVVHPAPRPIGDAEWELFASALVAAEKSAFYRGPRWSFERPPAEVKHAPTG